MPQLDLVTSEAAIRYADALIDLTEDTRGAMRGVERDMAQLRTMFRDAGDLRSAMRNPTIPSGAKLASLNAIAKKAGFHPLTQKFLGVVATNDRARDLPGIARAFADQLAARRGTTIAHVTSATKMTAAQLKDLKGKLEADLGKSVEIEHSTDPDLLGGFVARVGSRLYDTSLRTQLDDLRLALQSA